MGVQNANCAVSNRDGPPYLLIASAEYVFEFVPGVWRHISVCECVPNGAVMRHVRTLKGYWNPSVLSAVIRTCTEVHEEKISALHNHSLQNPRLSAVFIISRASSRNDKGGIFSGEYHYSSVVYGSSKT